MKKHNVAEALSAEAMFELTVMGGDHVENHVSIQATPLMQDASTQTVPPASIDDVSGLLAFAKAMSSTESGDRVVASSSSPSVPVPNEPTAALSIAPAVEPRSFMAVITSGVKTTKRKWVNHERAPACVDPSHRVHSRAGIERQRHSCRQCLLDDWRLLKTNPFLVPWQLALILGTTTRQYICMLCVLEKADALELGKKDIPKQTDCKKHRVFSQQAECTNHGTPWHMCFKCLHDPRAGKRCCLLCGESRGCGCPVGPLKLRDITAAKAKQLPEDQATLMAQLTKAILEYAALLQETAGIEDRVERALKVQQIKTTFRFPDTSKLVRVFKAVGC